MATSSTALPAPHALQARVQKLLASRTEVEATKALLSTLITSKESGKDATAAATPTAIVTMDSSASLADLRKNLRSSLEEKQLALAQSVLDGLGDTLTRIVTLKTHVDTLDMKCAQIQSFLETTKRETQQAQAEAAELASKQTHVQQELSTVKSFLAQYQLSEEEIQALYHTNLQDDNLQPFVAIMERIQTIKADCRALVAAGEVNCALELLDTVGKYQEVGFERLYQWTSKKCADVDGEPTHELHRAIALLRDRIEFYNYCKECITASRRSLIVRRFIIALTRGGPNGIPRPIEMHAHDPVRYCGDMLAWVHQAIATEHEFFRVLFDGDSDYVSASDQQLLTPDKSTDTSDTLPGATEESAKDKTISMVGKAFDGVARPLQVRIEQTLTAQHGIVIAYKLMHLLAFYHHKFESLVADSGVSLALQHCRDASNKAFKQQFQALVEAVAQSAQDYSTNLAATHATMEVSHRLMALLEVFQSSLLPEEEKEADLTPLFEGILPAVAIMCRRSISSLTPADALVFQVNNMTCIQVSLAKFPEAAKWYHAIGKDVEHWLRDLSELQAKVVMDRCGVSALLRNIQAFQTDDKTASTPELASQTNGLDGATISYTMDVFSSSLMAIVFPQFDHIEQPVLREQARLLTATTLSATYSFVYEFVHDTKYGYQTNGPRTGDDRKCVVLQHTPQEIRTVLEID